MIELIRQLGLYGVIGLAAVYLFKDVLGPLVKHVISKEAKEPGKVAVLEVNLTTLSARVTELSTLVEERTTAADNKLDIVLQELKEIREANAAAHLLLSERLARVEQDVKHLEKGPRRI